MSGIVLCLEACIRVAYIHDERLGFMVALQEKWVLIADRNIVFYDCAMFDIPVSFR